MSPFRPRLAFSADRPRSAAAEADGFRTAMLPHMDAAYDLARYLARDASAAEDIVQNAFLKAYRSFAAFRGETPRAWLFAIVRNCFLDWRRANPPAEAAEAPEPVDDDTPEAIVGRARDAEVVRASIETLPEPFREAIVLRELEELSYREIAMVTGVPIGTVMSRLARGREMLCALLLPVAAEGGR